MPARKPIQTLNGRMQPWENKGRLEFSLHAYTHTYTHIHTNTNTTLPVSIRKGLTNGNHWFCGGEGGGCKTHALLGPFSLSSLSLLLACNWPLEVVIKTGWLMKYWGRLSCQMEVFPDWSHCRLPVYADLGSALPTLSLRSDQCAKKTHKDSLSWPHGDKWMLGSPDAAWASVQWL